MLTADDFTSMAADLAAVRGDNEIEITIRRGDEELDPQSVRIERQGASASTQDSTSAQEARGKIFIMGGVDLDIQAEDRFNDDNGVLYKVVYIRPNRTVAVMAEAEAVE